MDHAPFLERALAIVPRDDTYIVERVSGRLPAFLRGTYYLNGPARFSRGPVKYDHWLDGDGLVCAVVFGGEDGVRITHRFVRTRKLSEEEAAERAIYRTFGTAFPGDRLNRGVALESPANISVYPFAGTLLAFGEQGLPSELDPIALETRGLFTFRGALTDVTPFSAHPKRDAATGELINFGVSFSAAHPMLNVYSFAAEGTLNWRRRLPLDAPRTIHDFAVTARHIAFYASPYVLDAAAIVRRGRTVMDALSWRPELGTRLLVLSRETGDVIASIPLGGCYSLHVVNGFDDGGDLVVDVIEYERPIYEQYRVMPELFTGVGRGRPVRYVAGADGVVHRRAAIAYSHAPDFPTTDPHDASRAYTEFWMLGISATGQPGRKFFDELVHADWSRPDRPDVYRDAAGRFFAGEPAVVSDPSGREAPVLICPMCDAEHGRTVVAIFPARDVARGPIASVELRNPLPPLFHSYFVAS